jgi:hypothetical protein
MDDEERQKQRLKGDNTSSKKKDAVTGAIKKK